MADDRYKSLLSKIAMLKDKRRQRAARIDADPVRAKKGRSLSLKRSPKQSPSSSPSSSSPRGRLQTARLDDDYSSDPGKSPSRQRQRHHRQKEIHKTKQIQTSKSKSSRTEDRFSDDKADDLALDQRQKETYIKFINDVCNLGVAGLMNEYMDHVKNYKPTDFRHEAFDRNFEKNRYRDVKCLDRTRVILKQEQDYIHANYVTGKYLLNTFICTQAPMKTTAHDFWTMIVQENACYIVMLCNLVEQNRKKCHSYYPAEDGEKNAFGNITVTNLHVDSQNPSSIMTLLQVEKENTKTLVLHIRWSKWPDRGAPVNELAPFEILKLVRQSPTRPTVVHCSAGVGRTGTIVAIEMGLQQLLNNEPLNLVELCKELRGMRAFSVQTDIQYIYIVKCLLAYAWCCGIFISAPKLIRATVRYDYGWDAWSAFGVLHRSKSDLFDQEYKEVMDAENIKPLRSSPSGITNEQISSDLPKSPSPAGRKANEKRRIRNDSDYNNVGVEEDPRSSKNFE